MELPAFDGDTLDMRTFDRDRPFAHVSMPKCPGTSFARLIDARLPIFVTVSR